MEEELMTRLSPLNALVFASLFQNMDSAPAMLELLNAILEASGEEPVEQILDLMSEYPLIAQGVGSKYGRVDVLVRTLSKRVFDFEVQIDWDSMNNRGFFYGGRLMTQEFKEGTPYSEMPRMRIINLLGFRIRKDNPELIQPVILAYEKEPLREATDVFKIYNIQMPVFRERHKTLESVNGNPFFTWLYLLDKGYLNEQEMEVLSGMSEGMRTFARQYHIAMNDPRLAKLYQMEQDAKRDEASRMRFAVSEALDKQKYEIASGLKRSGVSADIISNTTGLSEKEIEKL